MTTLAPLRRARVLAAGVLTTLAMLLVVPSASAHDVLIDSDPGGGDTLTQSPQAVTLTFNNNPLEVGSAIVVTDGDGETVVEGEGTVAGPDVTLELPDELPSGDYEAHWRVASSDGHPIDGVIPFTVEAPEPAEPADDPAATPQPEPADNPAATPQPEPTPEPEANPAATAEPEAGAESQTSGLSSLPLWLRVAIALAALASVVGLIIRVARRGRGDRV